MKPRDEIQKQYAARLYEQRSQGVLLKRLNVSVGEWQPLSNQCHLNVTELCTYDSRYKPVRGWLYFDLAPFPFVKFVSHSAVRTPDGHLYDITPTSVAKSYPFIPATESEDEYAAMNLSGITELWYCK
ncbi:hypothetical protein R2083_09830 [Nitrosomonas sp. Is35]|uniref:hypothetical protein n=1 Tax=unclassified Nitrosomonas TaxID=2609265 RepID=UPI00294B1325|nr:MULTISPECIES: hypothetical protein [unclassified Nitrosomonas]MDV6341911.1 hypothetical protein [Nitrosomonas sp. Is24]MDV6347812.1 hypothetical protein [Nitrosomonas sp. Is35]